ncbi:MAG: pyridoxal 5'-phosphate dependent enzyme [Wigglesworthia glossinidia]|nr:pyridoxal 5'-phosphate dependent enzyme [Wigglesworthia glossinidia]
MNRIQDNFQKIKKLIDKTAKSYHKDPRNINLLAVSKSCSVQKISAIYNCNQNHFGESYIQEAIKKIIWFQNNQPNKKIFWHMIGSIQSNKIMLVSKYFDWCHTIDSIKIAKKLNKYRESMQNPLQVLIQINIHQERNKHGAHPKEIKKISDFINDNCRYLKLRGIMAIPLKTNDLIKQREAFRDLYKIFVNLKHSYSNIDILSIGMTNDMISAIAEGSTLLRIGNGIFNLKKQQI